MATDWAADVKKYDPSADDGIIAGIVRYCGIALRKVDSSLVSFSDPKETARVRQNFLKKKLGLTEPDSVLDDAIAAVGARMKADRTKNRVTVYYLLAQSFGMLDQFAPKAKAAKASKADGAGNAAAAGAAGAAAMGLMGAADGDAAPAKASRKTAAPKASKPKPAASLAAPAKKTATAKADTAPAPAAMPASTADSDDSAAGGVIAAGAAGLAAAGAAGASVAGAASGAGAAAAEGAKDLAGDAADGVRNLGSAVTGAAGDAAEAAGDLARDAAAGVIAGVAAAGAAVTGAAGAATAGVASLMPGQDTSGSGSHASTADDDGGMGWLWWLLAALLLIGLIWWLFFRQPADGAASDAPASQTAASSNPVGTMAEGMAAGDTAPAGTDFAAAPAEGSVEIPAGAGVTSELRDGKPVVKVYFDTGKTAVAPAFTDAAGGLKAWLAANPGTSLAVSGYNDSTGNAAANAELSKNRAFAVRDALIASGIAATSVETVKPEETTAGAGDDAAARRVEVVVR